MHKIKTLMGLNLLDLSEKEWQALLEQHLVQNKPDLKIIMTPNPEQIMLMRRHDIFASALKQADYLIADGWGLVWASGVETRITGVETCKWLLNYSQKHQLKILLIGGYYQNQVQAQNLLKIPIFQTQIYYTKGYQNIYNPIQKEVKAVKKLISDICPDIVLVAFGAPKQEEWLIKHRNFLINHKVKIAMAVGGSFDFILYKIPRAPIVWQKLRLEWMWRLIQEPKRLKRQLVLPQFVLLKIIGRLK